MTGRITQRGDNLTISVNLVDTRNGKSLWGEQYERKMSELLATQKEITAEITNSLKLRLSGETELKLARRYSNNNEAYQLYLKGRFHFAKRTQDDILKGIDYFQQAITLDPKFALAYAAIAESYNSIGKNADLPPKEVLPKAKAAATRAMEIDPTLAEAHGALADSLAIFDWNWTESEREYERALQLDSNVSYIHLTHGVSYLVPVGKPDEAVAELQRAVELEPLSLINNAILGVSYLYARQYDKALEQGKKTYDLDPTFRFGRQYLGSAYIVLGRYDDAIALSEEGLKTSPLGQEDLARAGLAYAKSGRRREAERYIEALRESAKTKYVRALYLASIYAALGDKEKAFAELEQSFEDKDYFLPRIKADPFMDPLRSDPRFKEMLKRMGLPE
jgi:tetratricopeptide (TPR) repeat protein